MLARKAQNREHDRRRRETVFWRAWYKTAGWLNLRKIRLEIEPLCRRCKLRGRLVIATVVDHVKPHKGDRKLFFDIENTQSLCRLCHDASKQAEEHRGHAIGNTPDGRPVDPGHPWNAQR